MTIQLNGKIPTKICMFQPSRLPSAYQEVEYIQSSGTQYIDTGYEPNNLTNVVAKFNIIGGDNSRVSLYGAINTASGASRRAYILQLHPSDNYLRATVYSNTGSYAKQISSTNALSISTDYTVEHSNTNYIINGTSQGTFAGISTYNVGYNMYIFSVNEGGTSTQQTEMKLYSFKITENDTLIRDLVPCYRKADDVIGMYDLVNGQFYTNPGSGTFTKGSDVNFVEQEIKRITIRPNGTEKQIRPVGWKPGVNTLAYYPLETDTKDYSGNGRDGTNNGVTFSNGLGVFNGSSYVSLGTGSWTKIQTNMTISVWFKWNGSGSKDNIVISKSQYHMPSRNGGYYAITIHEEDRYLCGGYYTGSDYNMHPMNFRNTGGGSPTTGPVAQANKWYNVVITNDGTTKKAYIDGVLYATETANSTNTTTSIDTRIGSFVRYNYDSFFNGNISAVIFEDKTRTAQEVTDYYNLTKGNYGL